MRVQSAFLLAAALVAPALLSGCLSVQAAKDYWNDEGIVVVKVGTLPRTAVGQTVHEFEEFKIGIRGVVVEAVNEITPLAGALYANDPFGVDLVLREEEGEMLKVLEKRVRTKTVDEVKVQVILHKAVKDGKILPTCDAEAATRVEHPCVALPKGGQFILDRVDDPVEMKRAKTLTLHFPIAVIYDPKTDEYFLQSRSAREEAPVTIE